MVRQIFDTGAAAMSNLLGALAITAIRTPSFLPFFILTVPLSAVLILSLRHILSERNRRFRKEMEQVAQRISEMTHLIPVTRAHGLEENELARMTQSFLQLRESGLELDAGNALFGAASWALFNIFNIACLIAAAWASYTGALPITTGDVVMLTGYFSSLTGAVMGLAGLTPVLTKGLESIRSMGEVLESPDLERNEGKWPVTKVDGNFAFDNLSFQYQGSNIPAVHDIQLQVSAGETIALVGPSGAGKSTIINLVVGFVRPTQGQLLLDGRPMDSLDLRTYRRFLSVVPQETILFEGSVLENITYGMNDVREVDVRAALRDANAWEFIERLPEGLATRIGEHGAKLSGGQRQRIAIARALIRNPRVLILDEATSALDAHSEALVQGALERLMQGRTTFIVAHRLSTVRRAHRIIVLQEGKIVEEGRHEELLARGGLYFQLQADQII
jgi:ATP-binding cassette subfamily B protein